MALLIFGRQLTSTATVLVLMLSLGRVICDSTCPNGITNITGDTSGEIAYPSSGTYGINETKCWRIEVPKPYLGIGLFLDSLDIEECYRCNCDSVGITTNYGNFVGMQGICGRYSPTYFEYVSHVQSRLTYPSFDGRNTYIRFVSDDTVNYKGFKFYFIVRSRSYGLKSYLNATEGENIEFGTPKVGIKNYPASYDRQWFLIVPEGHRVQITFETFELEQSENCENDYVEVREAHFATPYYPQEIIAEFGAILSKPICGSTKPSPIQSAGNMVWVQFRSDSNTTTTYKGFKASFTSSAQRRSSISSVLTFLFISVLIMTTKDMF